MTDINFPRPMARSEGMLDHPEGESFLKSLINSKRINPELAPLKMMGELIEAYRQDIASMQREHEKLLDQKSTQDLVNIHMTHRMAEIQQNIKRSSAGLKALQADFFGYRAIIFNQKNKAKKSASNLNKQAAKKTKKA